MDLAVELALRLAAEAAAVGAMAYLAYALYRRRVVPSYIWAYTLITMVLTVALRGVECPAGIAQEKRQHAIVQQRLLDTFERVTHDKGPSRELADHHTHRRPTQRVIGHDRVAQSDTVGPTPPARVSRCSTPTAVP